TQAVEVGDAAGARWVLAVFPGENLVRAGLGTIPCMTGLANRDTSPIAMPPHAAIARDRVRHVGDAVAMVVAETVAQGRDAAERIAVDYEPLPAVVDTARALDPGQPAVWPAESGQRPGNLCFDWEVGDEAAVQRASAAARHRVSL